MASFDLGFAPARYRSPRPGYNGTDLQTFFATFPDDESCLEYLFKQRFDSDPICSRCGKRGRWRKHEWQTHYFHPCGGICSPMMGTIFARTRVPLQLWFYAMLCFTNSAEGMASTYLARHLGVSEPTGFHMARRIRTQMALVDRHERVGGLGTRVLLRIIKLLRIKNENKKSRNYAYLVVASDDQRVIACITRRPSRQRVKYFVDNLVHNGSIVGTDCYLTYRSMSDYGQSEPLADFCGDLAYALPKQAALNHGFFQYLSKSFYDQFKGVEWDNSWLYIKEYQFKFNRRERSFETFWDLISDFPKPDGDDINLLRRNNLLAN